MISMFRVAESMGFKGELRHWEECCGLETENRRARTVRGNVTSGIEIDNWH